MRLILTSVTIIILLSACETVPEQRGVNPVLVSSSTPTNQSLIALVIGNTEYEYGSLTNPVNDATDIAAVLRQIGFEVTLKTNLDQVAMGTAIRQFTARLSSQSVGLFYFAGHGTQVDGRNYLLPIDNNKIGDKHDLAAYTIDVNQHVLARMEENNSHLNIVILDACRNNPYRSMSRGAGRGLASIQSRQGSLIAFATSPGKTAADSSAGKRNGLYTKYLLKGLKQAHQTHQRIDDMLMQVGNGVSQESGRNQEPWYNASLRAPFCFGGCQASSSSLISNEQVQGKEKNELIAEIRPTFHFLTFPSYMYGTPQLDVEYGSKYTHIGGNAGLISKKLISLEKGRTIDIHLIANYDGTDDPSHNNEQWVSVFNFGLYSEKPNKNIRSLKGLSIETDSIVLKVAPVTINRPNYKGRSNGNTVYSSYKDSFIKVNGVYYVPLEWNQFTIHVVEKNILKLYVNGKETMVYNGKLPKKAYLGIGQDHTSIPYSIRNEIVINNKIFLINVALPEKIQM